MAVQLGASLPLTPWPLTAALSFLVWVMANFMSHTSAAAIVMPVVASLGMQVSHVRLVTMLSVLVDSSAMALPISGFPNILAFSAKDANGQPLLVARDFMLLGFPLGLAVWVIVMTLGYLIAFALGF
eukprot:Colp12_sorted_trinity150504_noHs@27396